MSGANLSIGDVAEQIGLSFRTIRYYDQVGLAVPSARTKGGHRLYTDDDVARLRLIMKMKPLDFTLEEMRIVLTSLDRLRDGDTPPDERAEARERLDGYRALVDERLRWLQERLAIAHDFRRHLKDELTRSVPEDAPSRPVGDGPRLG
jgi:DNA-binding transcriptional MerR regulator